MIEKRLLIHPYLSPSPCYRKVVCYSIFRFLKANNPESAQQELTKLKEHVEKNDLYLIEKFIEAYPLTKSEAGDIGFLVVESSRGCYPLVCYANSHSELGGVKNKPRKSGFKAALRVLEKNHSKIFPILLSYIKEHKEWDAELESMLREFFEYPQDKSNQAANDNNFNEGLKKTG